MLQVPVSPTAVGSREEYIVLQAVRSVDTLLKNLDDIAVAEVAGILGNSLRPVLPIHQPEPDAEHREAECVGIVASERLVPRLGGAVDSPGKERRAPPLNRARSTAGCGLSLSSLAAGSLRSFYSVVSAMKTGIVRSVFS